MDAALLDPAQACAVLVAVCRKQLFASLLNPVDYLKVGSDDNLYLTTV